MENYLTVQLVNSIVYVFIPGRDLGSFWFGDNWIVRSDFFKNIQANPSITVLCCQGDCTNSAKSCDLLRCSHQRKLLEYKLKFQSNVTWEACVNNSLSKEKLEHLQWLRLSNPNLIPNTYLILTRTNFSPLPNTTAVFKSSNGDIQKRTKNVTAGN